MINNYNNMCSNLLSNLLDTYSMEVWEMTWLEFLALAQKEINEYLQDLIDNADKYFDTDDIKE